MDLNFSIQEIDCLVVPMFRVLAASKLINTGFIQRMVWVDGMR